MSHNVFPFPVDRLKAETLRSVAKDLNLSPGGKKEDVLERLRKFSESGSTTPSKRKGGDESSEPPSPDRKKPKTPTTPKTPKTPKQETPSTPVRSSRRRGAVTAPVPTSQLPNSRHGGLEADEETSKPLVINDDFGSGTTSVFIAADSLIGLVDSEHARGDPPNSNATSFLQPRAAFAKPDHKAEERVRHWLVVDEEGAVQNVTAFREAHETVLEQETRRREGQLQTKVSEKKIDGKDVKEGAEVVTEHVVKQTWYEVLVSKRMSKGALAVKLVRDVIDGVLSHNDVDEGTFWLSDLKPTSQENADMLDSLV